ncbi:Flp family type IVb pilin [Nitrosomonas sp. Is37]|uniref:Flp family type IVb pilin n=1 Tax=Nitrosomonas sp. Is37 TaxID=3080535 RepID=UPI00294B625E|nr:Flp family type IVb pilin [Nitrosomonas sp. Is37]MDV6343365.1 Flp family type IVb pilin [Nitrosomonas sp. Is37]
MMTKLIQSIKKFINDEKGMGAVEYAIIIAIMAGAITLLWPKIQTALGTAIDNVSTQITNTPKQQ